jgi:HEPN domain-containing protein
MNRPAREWIVKAEGDYATALREVRARKNPNYDAACFHAQQCIEKYLKGILEARCVSFARTHDLSVLLNSSLGEFPLWETFRPDLELLTQYAIAFRYPGETATKADARHAVAAATKLRKVFRTTVQRRSR